MDDIEHRLLRLEQAHEAVERIEKKVDRLVEANAVTVGLRTSCANQGVLLDKAFEKIDQLRQDQVELKQTVHTRWALARGVGLAAGFFWAMTQSIFAFMATDFVSTAQMDHERIIRLQEQLDHNARGDAVAHPHTFPPASLQRLAPAGMGGQRGKTGE